MQKIEADVLDSNANQKGILLESGTNEFEIVEFNIGDVYYGINVAKVREVITRVPVTAMPSAHSYVDGLFTLRGRAMPLVNLARAINAQGSDDPKNIIVTEINNYNIGFLVDSVSRIHRISWKNMEPSPEVGNNSVIVGVIKMTDKIVLLLDFEKIIAEINSEINQKLSTFDKADSSLQSLRKTKHIVIAEDSKMLRDLLVDTLHQSGYEFVRDFNTGKAAYEYLTSLKNATGSIEDHLTLIISDIEMPQMDGHRMLKLVREDDVLNKTPVILFSSLINEEMRLKGDRLGATAQISKPEIGQLINLMDDIIFTNK
ncbi:chemotaxis protein [Pectinatus brassicae]|uniref:Two-component system chemotaxis response regulator CheV n=1 Tax=Pectinatus brassicae TaxID=862415 RepID=A0A840UP38_9FIRM|nr:chemotaxis protein [Pectinatus brassicae]MBB5336468.1 two-component system chemotaxis response regulator CheV [Pectinatus brassicae]